MSVPRKFQGKFKGCFKNVERVFQVRLKGVSRVSERRLINVFGSFMGVSMLFWCFMEVSRKIQECLK